MAVRPGWASFSRWGAVSLRCFLSSLAETGRVQVAEPEAPLEQVQGEADELLAVYDRLARDQLAFAAPRFVPAVARWAAELMYRGCQLLVFRRLDARAVQTALSVTCPQPLSADAIYSADLLLRYLGDLLRMARAVADRDVLVAELLRLGGQWPLSSIGAAKIDPNQLDLRAVDLVMADRCLRQLYIDRVITHRDLSRLDHRVVLDGVHEALGLYHELWPEAAARVHGDPEVRGK
ncbi:MAG TPA: hypothetical protein VG125_01325 [Pirellulales bacterium]|jgi:hypothetical protein|nr:hypothetical protein [Pirellulales bacterium]